MFAFFDNLSSIEQGWFLISAGFVLLLYILGFMRKFFTLLLIGIALYAIFSGSVKAGIVDRVRKLIARYSPKK
jgi:hypothetical protein